MSATHLRLGVNVDHVATIRNARGGTHPDPVRAAQTAIAAGADSITAHLREDRRHIRDEDIAGLKAAIAKPLNLEMAATAEMAAIAVKTRPHAACLVPERREERTTEGGLDVAGQSEVLAPVVARLREAGIRVSLFIAAEPRQIQAAVAIGAPVIEIHTGAWCDALADGRLSMAKAEWQRIRHGAQLARRLGLEVHAGHGLDYDDRRSDRGTTRDRRTQHRPLPDRGGGLFRPRRCRADHACGHGPRPRMILGIGSDLIDVRRIERTIARHGERFLGRIFTATERAKAEGRARRVETYAKRFAAKEACAKALGTGLRAGVFWRDMGVVNLPSGRPTMKLTGGALARLRAITPAGCKPRIDVTITDEGPMAQALVVITAVPATRRDA